MHRGESNAPWAITEQYTKVLFVQYLCSVSPSPSLLHINLSLNISLNHIYICVHRNSIASHNCNIKISKGKHRLCT